MPVNSDFTKRTTPSPGPAAPEPRRLPPVQASTLAEKIAALIIKAASEGKFKLGERLYESELARDLGVSRLPVREALKQLESQGITVSTPNRGMRLMTVNDEELRQIFIVRLGLEQIAVREWVKQPPRNDYEEIEQALQGMGQAVPTQDAYAMAVSDISFHHALVRAASNSVLLKLWETLATKLTIILGLASADGLASTADDFERLYRGHCHLLDLIKSRDLEKIQSALEQHGLEQSEWASVRRRFGLEP